MVATMDIDIDINYEMKDVSIHQAIHSDEVGLWAAPELDVENMTTITNASSYNTRCGARLSNST
jgi:hypothetical protein